MVESKPTGSIVAPILDSIYTDPAYAVVVGVTDAWATVQSVELQLHNGFHRRL